MKTPEIIKIPKIINKMIVKKTRVLNANFWVLNTTIAVKRINIMVIGINKYLANGKGKKASITTEKAWAENENVAMFAIHKKKTNYKS